MKEVLLWVCSLGLFFSCGKADAGVISFNGTYIGYFHRNQQDTTQVSFYFDDNQYCGFRMKKFCPSMGRGNFFQDENSIKFQRSDEPVEEGNHPVLDGQYHYEISNDGSLRIWRDTGGISDEFILRKSADEGLAYGYQDIGFP